MCGLLQIMTNQCPKDSSDCSSLSAILTSACGEGGGSTAPTVCCWKQDCKGGTLCLSTNTCGRACEISCSETNIQIPTGAQLDIVSGAFYYDGQLVECV